MAVKLRKNPASVLGAHPLNALDFLKVEIWWEDTSRAWVTSVPALNGISDYGATEQEALDRTAAMILAAIDGMEEDGVAFPWPADQVRELRRVLEDYR